MAIGDRPPSVYAYMPPPVLRTHTPGDAPRIPASGPRSVFRLFRGCNKYRSAPFGALLVAVILVYRLLLCGGASWVLRSSPHGWAWRSVPFGALLVGVGSRVRCLPLLLGGSSSRGFIRRGPSGSSLPSRRVVSGLSAWAPPLGCAHPRWWLLRARFTALL